MPPRDDFLCRACGHGATYRMCLLYTDDSGTEIPVWEPATSLVEFDTCPTLAQLGTTHRRAARARRLHMASHWACAGCGGLVPHRRIYAPELTCDGLIGLGGFLVTVAILLSRNFRHHVPGLDAALRAVGVAGLVAAWALIVAAAIVIDALLTRWWYRKIIEPTRPSPCPTCGARKWLDPEAIVAGANSRRPGTPPDESDALRCPRCGKRSLLPRDREPGPSTADLA